MNNKPYLTLCESKGIHNTKIEYQLVIDEEFKITLGEDIRDTKNRIFELIAENTTKKDLVNIFESSMEYFLLSTIFSLADKEDKNISILFNKDKITILRNNEFLFECAIRFETYLLFKFYDIKNIAELEKIFN